MGCPLPGWSGRRAGPVGTSACDPLQTSGSQTSGSCQAVLLCGGLQQNRRLPRRAKQWSMRCLAFSVRRPLHVHSHFRADSHCAAEWRVQAALRQADRRGAVPDFDQRSAAPAPSLARGLGCAAFGRGGLDKAARRVVVSPCWINSNAEVRRAFPSCRTA
jgi:hypothetical protein